MIKSMTGFGRAELSENGKKVAAELKSVNHRYLDISIRMPKKFNYLEADIRNLLKSRISRGKVDVFITYEDMQTSALGLKYNKELAQAYMDHIKQMESDFGLDAEPKIPPYVLARFPEVLSMEDVSEDDGSVWDFLKRCIEEAVDRFESSKQKEGEALKADILEKLGVMDEDVKLAEERYPQILSEYEARLRQKLDELLENNQIEESRIAAEMVLFADKLCTDEETVRLHSHIAAMSRELENGGEAGRKLDFMAQEMNREANTLLSKANDFRTSEIGIALKTTIEKIREQIQNIE